MRSSLMVEVYIIWQKVPEIPEEKKQNMLQQSKRDRKQ